MWRARPTQDPLQPHKRLLSPNERAILGAQLAKWLDQGYIEKSRAWVTCNPLFVPKQDGSMRTCIDYRPINKVDTVWDWPLPKIREIRHRLAGSSWYSKIDLREAFHRISVDHASRPLTAFHTHLGNFQFTRMPFGLATAPPTYQRFIEWVLRPVLHLVIVYLDDILIYSGSRPENVKANKLVRKWLDRGNVEIREDKSHGPQRQTKFVGLTVRAGTVGCALSLGEPITPRTIKQWQSVLGYANCFRDYLPAYADKTAGLYPGADQLPDLERQEKFRVLWKELAQAVSLEHYRDDQPGELFLDASKQAVGAVLTQSGKVCAIFSKALTRPQSNYSATDREHLALMLGLEAFRIFVQSNQKVVTRTDHSALLNRNESRMTARQLRWKLRVEEITTNIVHVPGVDNPADFWSRQGHEWGGDMFSVGTVGYK